MLKRSISRDVIGENLVMICFISVNDLCPNINFQTFSGKNEVRVVLFLLHIQFIWKPIRDWMPIHSSVSTTYSINMETKVSNNLFYKTYVPEIIQNSSNLL